jgi:hypothetical protein
MGAGKPEKNNQCSQDTIAVTLRRREQNLKCYNHPILMTADLQGCRLALLEVGGRRKY